MEVVFGAGASRVVPQFQMRVFLEAVIALRPLNFLKTCRAFDVAPRAAPSKTHRHAFARSSISRLNPLRRRMNRRPLLESVFFAPRACGPFLAPHSRGARGTERRLDALLAQGRHVVVHLQVPRLAHALRPGAVQLVKCASRAGRRAPVSNCSTPGKDDMAPVFGEGGNLPTRFSSWTRC